MKLSFIANASLANTDHAHVSSATGVDRPSQLSSGLFQLPVIWSNDVKSSRSGYACLFLDFHTSQNEEHTSLCIQCASTQSIDLGERVHHYVMLLLARRKLEDARRGLEPDSCGWIVKEQLTKMLGVDGAYLNIQFHRVRAQFGGALGGSDGWPAPIERRRGEVRLGLCWFRIVRGSTLEGEFISEIHQM